jgi:hypothetical protein
MKNEKRFYIEFTVYCIDLYTTNQLANIIYKKLVLTRNNHFYLFDIHDKSMYLNECF